MFLLMTVILFLWKVVILETRDSVRHAQLGIPSHFRVLFHLTWGSKP